MRSDDTGSSGAMLASMWSLVGDGVAGGAIDGGVKVGVDEPSARSGDGSIVCEYAALILLE